MATQFTITKVDFPTPPAGLQTGTFEYKLFSATSWTLISGGASINTNGTLVAALIVSGLVAGQLYYVRFHNNCESPPTYYTQQVQL